MTKLKSSVPGLIYPSGRDSFLKTSFGYLDGRRKDDGAEGLWRIKNSLYDLEHFVDLHPGGAEWLRITKGTDITEAFEVHHITTKAERLLAKYYVREAVVARPVPFTFEDDGFYRKFKARVREILKDVDFHNPSTKSKFLADFIVTMAVVGAILTATYKSWIIIFLTGLFVAWTANSAHNFFHMRDSFRMYYFDLSMMSSKEWRISHVLSHHLYPNTLWDMEIYLLEPFLAYLPSYSNSKIYRIWTLMSFPIIWSLSFLGQGIKRYYSIYYEWRKIEMRDFIPFLLPVLMSFFASSITDAVKLWLCINLSSSFIFSFIGFTAAHHHPAIFHDGDKYRQVDNLDWGLLEIDTTRDRTNIDGSLFLVLTNFGRHSLHHLLPTVDHAYLSKCFQAFEETCQEFGVYNENLNSWELIKGNFKQLGRTKTLWNHRGAPDSVVKKAD